MTRKEETDGRRRRLVARGIAAEERLLRAVTLTDPHAWLDLDLTMPQLKTLIDLATLGRARVGDLAAALSVAAPTMSGIVERLVRRALVTREAAVDDRRVTWVSLTDQGRQTVERLFGVTQRELGELLGKLDTPALETVTEAFELLADAAEKSSRTAPTGVTTATFSRPS